MKLIFMMFLAVSLLSLSPAVPAEGSSPGEVKLRISPPLLDLLREEMREVSAGVQGIPPALATANWELVVATSAKIRASYIMERKLSKSQSAELERALPAEFKRMDAEFHLRAEKLGLAAAAHDADLAIHYYARMLESCAECHSRFASSRFPGFTPAVQDVHHR